MKRHINSKLVAFQKKNKKKNKCIWFNIKDSKIKTMHFNALKQMLSSWLLSVIAWAHLVFIHGVCISADWSHFRNVANSRHLIHKDKRSEARGFRFIVIPLLMAPKHSTSMHRNEDRPPPSIDPYLSMWHIQGQGGGDCITCTIFGKKCSLHFPSSVPPKQCSQVTRLWTLSCDIKNFYMKIVRSNRK